MPRSRRPIAAMPVPSSNRLEGSGVTDLNVYLGAPIPRYALPSRTKDCVAVYQTAEAAVSAPISHPLKENGVAIESVGSITSGNSTGVAVNFRLPLKSMGASGSFRVCPCPDPSTVCA